MDVRSRISSWRGCRWAISNSADLLFHPLKSFTEGKMQQRKAWFLVLYGALWSVWLVKNECVFSDKNVEKFEDVLDSIPILKENQSYKVYR